MELFSTLVVISPQQKLTAGVKIGAASSKFCLLSHNVIVFPVSLKVFEKIQFYKIFS